MNFVVMVKVLSLFGKSKKSTSHPQPANSCFH